MDDEELQILRAKRLAELQGQHNPGAPGNQAAAEEQKAKEEEFRNTILTQVLSKEARSRLSTISIAKPENGKMLENMIINMARTGQIRSQLDDKEFVHLLEEVNRQIKHNTPTVKFDRRRAAVDSDDDY
ncbi:programmed cell death protein 5-like [Uloborus diversus]|uniref:programmed cell death protein 5-like n=1 Tax=Uloborus diversus TaxID=327109 RepID=UPI0024096E9B|nr:programmed cell death protein 5-like [Uloborus diversus]